MICKNCGNKTEFIPNFVHECIETNEDVVHDCYVCPVCTSLHYKEDGYNVFEFTPKILELSKTINGFATDYDVALNKMKENEKV